MEVESAWAKRVNVPSLDKLCRLCLKEAKLGTLLKEELNISSSVLDFLKAELDGTLPESVCKKCLQELIQISSFINKCKHSHSILTVIESEYEKMKPNKKLMKIQIVKCDEPSKSEEDDIKRESNDDPVVEVSDDEVEEIRICKDEDFEEITTEETVEDKNIAEIKIPLDNNTEEEKVIPKEVKVKKEFTPKPTTRIVRPPKMLRFKICPKCGESVTKMNDHYKVSRTCCPRNIKCPECNMSFTSTPNLKTHQIAHHWNDKKYPTYICSICSKVFKFKLNLKRHLDIHKFGRRFVCEVCGKGYTTNVKLMDHKNLHTGDQPFACSFCQRTFASRNSCLKHENIHKSKAQEGIADEASQAELECPVCHRIFKEKRCLNKHMVIHADKTFKCETCGQAFLSEQGLKRHRDKIHQSERRFVCSACGKKYNSQQYLDVHMRSHSGERPYLCAVCSKGFTQMAHLMYHMLLHKGEKAFKCEVCGKAFTKKGNLTVHMRLHSGERPYLCHICGRGFCDTTSRKRHVAAKHGEDEVQNILTKNLS